MDQSNGQSWTVDPNIPGTPQGSDDEKTMIQQAIEQFLSQARALYETMKNKGSIAGGISLYLDEIMKVEIPWETLLEKAIKTNTIMKPDDRSWRKLNNYYIPHGLTLPGYSMTEDNDGVGLLVVAVDTSGSINDKTLQKFSSVIVQSMKYFKQIMLITHDVDVHQVKTFEKDEIHTFVNFAKTEGFHGRGGTSHQPVFQYIEDHIWNENDKKDDLSMIISLTDLESDTQSIYKNFKWIRNNTPLVFVIDGRRKLQFEYDSIVQITINN